MIDIDPDTLNLKSQGRWITCYIELPAGCDVRDVDVGTILLEGAVAAEVCPTEIGDQDGDGILDLMVKFDRSATQAFVGVGDVKLTVTGEIGQVAFEGSDNIRVIDPGQGQGNDHRPDVPPGQSDEHPSLVNGHQRPTIPPGQVGKSLGQNNGQGNVGGSQGGNQGQQGQNNEQINGNGKPGAGKVREK